MWPLPQSLASTPAVLMNCNRLFGGPAHIPWPHWCAETSLQGRMSAWASMRFPSVPQKAALSDTAGQKDQGTDSQEVSSTNDRNWVYEDHSAIVPPVRPLRPVFYIIFQFPHRTWPQSPSVVAGLIA